MIFVLVGGLELGRKGAMEMGARLCARCLFMAGSSSSQETKVHNAEIRGVAFLPSPMKQGFTEQRSGQVDSFSLSIPSSIFSAIFHFLSYLLLSLLSSILHISPSLSSSSISFVCPSYSSSVHASSQPLSSLLYLRTYYSPTSRWMPQYLPCSPRYRTDGQATKT